MWKELRKTDDVDLVSVSYDVKTRSFNVLPTEDLENLVRALVDGTDSKSVNKFAQSVHNKTKSMPVVEVSVNSIMLVLGTPWIHDSYFQAVGELKNLGMRVVTLLYDLIPLVEKNFPEPSRIQFTEYLTQLSWISDHVATISQATRDDYEVFGKQLQIPTPSGVVTQLPGGFQELNFHVGESDEKIWPRDFVLSVGTIEERKDHIVALRAWKQLIAERGIDNVPDLVCVGRIGWNVSEFLDAWTSDKQIQSKIHLLYKQVSDNDLERFYENCLFTIYPSRYEGWGLPVSESLDFGKAVIATRASSVPEAGAEFAKYFDAGDHNQLARLVAEFLDNSEELQLLENKIKSRKSIAWSDVAERLKSLCIAPVAQDKSAIWPEFVEGIEYGLRAVSPLNAGFFGQEYLRLLQIYRLLPLTKSYTNASNLAQSRLLVSFMPTSKFQTSTGIRLRALQNSTMKFHLSNSKPGRYTLCLAINGNLSIEVKIGNSHVAHELLQRNKTCIATIPFLLKPDENVQNIEVKFNATNMHQSLISFVIIATEKLDASTLDGMASNLSFASKNNLSQKVLQNTNLPAVAYQNSFSWKITSPMRAVHRFLNKFLQ